jgi:putative hydrolase of the HAD superfamily
MAAIFGSPVARLEEAYWRDRNDYDLGRLDGPAYWHGIAKNLDRGVTTSQIDDLIGLDIKSWMQPNAGMMAWVRCVRAAGMRTAILSNMPYEHRNWIVDESGWLSDFDHTTFSCDLGVAKPSATIYEHCLTGLQTSAIDTLFLDDRHENIAGARSLGIHAVHFTTPGETLVDIHDRYHVPAWASC